MQKGNAPTLIEDGAGIRRGESQPRGVRSEREATSSEARIPTYLTRGGPRSCGRRASAPSDWKRILPLVRLDLVPTLTT